jgi:anti-sigma regulatory factor (Ser/Thr protein kinase)
MPDVMVRSASGDLRESYPSSDLPLGIVDDYQPTIVTTGVSHGDIFVIYSDGVIEAHDERGELFGSERLNVALDSQTEPDALLSSVVAAVSAHVQSAQQNDDLSMLVVQYMRGSRMAADVSAEQGATLHQRAMTWDYAVTLLPDDLRDGEPVSKVVQVIDAAQGVGPIRTQLFLILTELFSNALEHGLLGLDSRIKRSPDGFADYYLQRAARLSELQDRRISIRCTHRPVAEGGCLKITIHHDGVGFDPNASVCELPENLEPSGRGISLVKSLCNSLEYRDGGRCATATYVWRGQ